MISAFEVGDLVEWNMKEGKPPWEYVKKTSAGKDWQYINYGIIYDITWTWDPDPRIMCYMVCWNNSKIFPAWEKELVLIRKGMIAY